MKEIIQGILSVFFGVIFSYTHNQRARIVTRLFQNITILVRNRLSQDQSTLLFVLFPWICPLVTYHH